MPKRLLERCQPDSIREFRKSARQRYDDALCLAGNGRRLAAIYLWGYSAEMNLKAAYFSFLGMPETTAITWNGHLRPAIANGVATFHIAWPPQGAGHNVRAWAELLVAERAAAPGMGYAPAVARLVLRYGQRIGQLWRETLRYHKNIAYPHEVRQVREAAEWFLVNADNL